MALTLGWEVSDLSRALIVLATTGTWLALEKQENLDRLLEMAALRRMTNLLETKISGHGEKRPYATRSQRDTDVLTVFLPAEFAKLVEYHAATKGVSKNDFCASLLTNGLLMYVTAEKAFLEAIVKVRSRVEGQAVNTKSI